MLDIAGQLCYNEYRKEVRDMRRKKESREQHRMNLVLITAAIGLAKAVIELCTLIIEMLTR